jgi:hypothetical protein
MAPKPKPPPEALLIERKRKAIVPRLSQRNAALKAGMSETRWRQIEVGGRWFRGRWEPEIAPPDTLARMAHVVGVTPGELREAGREDASLPLETLLASPPDEIAHLVEGVREARGLSDRQKDVIIDLINRTGA